MLNLQNKIEMNYVPEPPVLDTGLPAMGLLSESAPTITPKQLVAYQPEEVMNRIKERLVTHMEYFSRHLTYKYTYK